jgi:hypothetical protein
MAHFDKVFEHLCLALCAGDASSPSFCRAVSVTFVTPVSVDSISRFFAAIFAHTLGISAGNRRATFQCASSQRQRAGIPASTMPDHLRAARHAKAETVRAEKGRSEQQHCEGHNAEHDEWRPFHISTQRAWRDRRDISRLRFVRAVWLASRAPRVAPAMINTAAVARPQIVVARAHAANTSSHEMLASSRTGDSASAIRRHTPS